MKEITVSVNTYIVPNNKLISGPDKRNQSGQRQPDPRKIRQRYLSVHNLHSPERVVGNQEITVEVGENADIREI